jgi:hypothetical protein
MGCAFYGVTHILLYVSDNSLIGEAGAWAHCAFFATCLFFSKIFFCPKNFSRPHSVLGPAAFSLGK